MLIKEIDKKKERFD